MSSTVDREYKKYKNRKIYCITDSCYVTFDEIVEEIQSGFSIRIISNETREDVTNEVLLGAIFKRQEEVIKEYDNKEAGLVLTDILRSEGGLFIDYINDLKLLTIEDDKIMIN